MTNSAWVLTGAAAAGIGGALTNWAYFAAAGERNPDILPVAAVVGAAYAALAGGLLSAGRGGQFGTPLRLLHAATSVAFIWLLFFTCYYGGVWLPALGGGLTALGALWTVLRVCGVRTGSPS